MTITVYHMRYDLTPSQRRAIIDPDIEDWQQAMKDGTLGDKEEDARIVAASSGLRDGLYVAVAEVEGGDLNVALANTNNRPGLDSWSQEPADGVRPFGLGHIENKGERYGYKSSEIGDVFVRDGEAFVLNRRGFDRIPLATAFVPERLPDDASPTI